VNTSVPPESSKAGKRNPPRELRVFFEPAQPACDHEMQHEKRLTLERDDDALPHSPDADDFPSFGGGDRWHHTAQHEGFMSRTRSSVCPIRLASRCSM